MNNIKHWLYDYFISFGLTTNSAKYLNMLGLLLALLIIVFIVDFVTRKLIVKAFTQFASVSKSNFDDLLVNNKVPRNVAHIIPLLIALEFIREIFIDFPDFENIVEKGVPLLDFVFSHKFNKNFSLNFNAKNLLNPSLEKT